MAKENTSLACGFCLFILIVAHARRHGNPRRRLHQIHIIRCYNMVRLPADGGGHDRSVESLTHITLRISGMTCVNCQNRIERKLNNTAGVAKASVSYSAGTAEVTFDTDIISLEDIISVIEGLDYRVLQEHQKGGQSLSHRACTLVIILCLYILLQHFGILNLLVPDRLADGDMGYGMLFLVGLLTSVHCIAMCGGINLSQCVPRGSGEMGRRGGAFMPGLLYNLGRVISYTLIGFLLGLVGYGLGGGGRAGLPTLLQGILKLAAGVFMVVMGVNMLGLFPWLRRLAPRLPKGLTQRPGRKRGTAPLAVGLLNGLMPCGPLQSMQLVALASGNPLTGGLSMLVFSLGTVPLMLGLGSVVAALGKRFTRTVNYVGSILVAVLGLAMLSQGASLSGLLRPDALLILIVTLCLLGVVEGLPFPKASLRLTSLAAVACAGAILAVSWSGSSGKTAGDGAGQAELVDGVQVVTSSLASGRYPDITVQAGTPVRWIIDAPEGTINGCNYKMLLQEFGLEYVFREGENVVTFTPTQAGTYRYSCWMGMIHGNIYVTEPESNPAN